MDLAKIIADLRLELQTMNMAIASLEALARIQKVPGSAPRHAVAASDRSAREPAPAKRPRGRPRKNPLPVNPAASHDAPSPSDEDGPENPVT